MALRVRSVDPTGEERDRLSADSECGTVTCAVDAVRSPGHHDRATCGQLAGEVTREHLAVCARGAGSDDRDSGGRAQQPRVTAHPENGRRMHPEVVERSRPVSITRNQKSGSDVPGAAQRIDHAPRVGSGLPPRPPVGECPAADFWARHVPGAQCEPERVRSTELFDERPGHTIARLGEDRPRHPGERLHRTSGGPELFERLSDTGVTCE
jgi:hypothetical protein